MKEDCRTCEYHFGEMISPIVKEQYNLHSCSYEYATRKAKGLESLNPCENYSYKIRYDDDDMKEIRMKLEKQLASEGVKWIKN